MRVQAIKERVLSGAIPSLRRPWLLWPMVLALLLRLALITLQIRTSLFDMVFDAADTTLYRSLATELIGSGRYVFHGNPTAYVTPGYPLFLALLYTVSRSAVFIGLVQSLLGAATVGLIAATAYRLAGKRAAWFAGLIGSEANE